MVDGKGHRLCGRDIGRVRDLLEIGLQREGQRKEHLVQHIKPARDHEAPAEPVQPAIGQKHQRQPDIFKGHHPPLAEMAQGAPHHRGRHHLQHVIHQQKHGHL